MYPLRNIKTVLKFPRTFEVQYSTEPLKLEKVLILHKLSRLEIERLISPELTDLQIRECINKRGLDYEALVKNDNLNKEFREKVFESFEKFGVAVKTVNRFSCLESDVEWCDALIPVGGDGTLLHSTRYINDNTKPVIGFNSDPARSEGFLCLHKKYSNDVPGAIAKILEGKFKWLFRTRIRVNIKGQDPLQSATELHDVNVKSCKSQEMKAEEKIIGKKKSCNITPKLPVLALNEVFLSEIFAARISFFEMRLNDSNQSVKIKSSGLCICTGTGSTSWNSSINSLSRHDINDILKFYITENNLVENEDFEDMVTKISLKFNENLKFGPEEQLLCYTVRDLVSLNVWPTPKGLIKPRGFAETIEVRSHCYDAGLIIDGGYSFPFNEGAVANLEIRPEDSLRTAVLLD